MKSVIVHYQEIALKGKNRPWFVARLVRNLREATRRSRRSRSARADGPDRARARTDRATGRRFATGLSARVRHRQLRARRPRAARRRRDRRRDPAATSATRKPATFRVSARRADKRFPLTSPQIEREVGGRIKEARGWTVDLAQSGADDPRRGADRRGVLLLRQGARRRRAAGRRRAAASRACSRAASIRRSPRGG